MNGVRNGFVPTVYSRDLKIAAMRALDAGSATGEIARKYQLSPKLLERWRGEWRAKGEPAFPGVGRQRVVGGGVLSEAFGHKIADGFVEILNPDRERRSRKRRKTERFTINSS